MAEIDSDKVASQIETRLALTKYACSSLTPLSGGTANFLFKGTLQNPLDDGTAEVVIKHGEAFSASWSALKLSQARCVSDPPLRQRHARPAQTREPRML